MPGGVNAMKRPRPHLKRLVVSATLARCAADAPAVAEPPAPWRHLRLTRRRQLLKLEQKWVAGEVR